MPPKQTKTGIKISLIKDIETEMIELLLIHFYHIDPILHSYNHVRLNRINSHYDDVIGTGPRFMGDVIRSQGIAQVVVMGRMVGIVTAKPHKKLSIYMQQESPYKIYQNILERVAQLYIPAIKIEFTYAD